VVGVRLIALWNGRLVREIDFKLKGFEIILLIWLEVVRDGDMLLVAQVVRGQGLGV
jgi:hypothetical protein